MKVPRFSFLARQQWDVPAQRFVTGAGLLEKVRPLARLLLQGRLIQLLNLLPTFGSHCYGDEWRVMSDE
jgi:hypothetical protein